MFNRNFIILLIIELEDLFVLRFFSHDAVPRFQPIDFFFLQRINLGSIWKYQRVLVKTASIIAKLLVSREFLDISNPVTQHFNLTF